MSGTSISIRLSGNGRIYRPGEVLEGEYTLHAAAPEQLRAIELSVLWYTEGKGEEDLAVPHFERRNTEQGDWIPAGQPLSFRTILPASPLSYEGLIVNIRWCVRVRAFFHWGKEVVEQKHFRLGCAPIARAEPENAVAPSRRSPRPWLADG